MDITDVKPCPFCGGSYIHKDNCYILALESFFLKLSVEEGDILDSELQEIQKKLDEKWNVRYEPTCKNIAENSTDFECSRCGTQYWDVYEVRYCPACGKRVEKYRED